MSEDEARAARLSPGLIRKLRKRLALSQAAVARLVGVSPAAVVQWEQGRATPAGKNRAALVGLRRLGRRQAKRLLASAAAERAQAAAPGGVPAPACPPSPRAATLAPPEPIGAFDPAVSGSWKP